MINNIRQSKSLMEWMFSIVIPIECILLQYKIGIFNIGVLLLLAISFFSMLSKKKIVIDKEFGFFIFLLCTQQILSLFIVGGNSINRLYNIFLVVMMFFACSIPLNLDCDCNKVYKKCLFVAILITIPIFVQSVLVYGFGEKVNSIMILPQAKENLTYWSRFSDRPCGLFTEPQTYSSYMIPFVVLGFKQKKIWTSIILTIGIILTGSSLGIGMITIVWFIFILRSDLSIGKKSAIIITIILFTTMIFSLDLFGDAIEKIIGVFEGYSTYSSGNMFNSNSYSNYLRLIKGWVTYFELPKISQIVGVGISGFRTYAISNGLLFSWSNIWSFSNPNSAYFSSAAGVFIECGLIIAIIYYRFIAKKIKNGKFESRIIMIMLLLQGLFSQMFFNGLFAMYIIFYYMLSEDDSKKLNIVLFRR